MTLEEMERKIRKLEVKTARTFLDFWFNSRRFQWTQQRTIVVEWMPRIIGDSGDEGPDRPWELFPCIGVRFFDGAGKEDEEAMLVDELSPFDRKRLPDEVVSLFDALCEQLKEWEEDGGDFPDGDDGP